MSEMIITEQMKKKLRDEARASLIDFDPQHDIEENGSDAPDYRDGGDEDPFNENQPLSDGTRLGNLEAQNHTRRAEHEVLGEYAKKLEERIAKLEAIISQAAPSLGITSVDMGL